MITSNLFSSKALTAAVTALALSAQAVTFSTNAAAHDRYRGYDNGYSRRYDGPRDYGRRDFDRRDHYFVEKRHRDHRGRNIALGIGAVMLGAIIAAEASRR